MKNANKLKMGAGAAAALATAGAANAAIDVTAVTTVIGDVLTAAGVIGLAVLGMHFGIKGYKWIKGAG